MKRETAPEPELPDSRFVSREYGTGEELRLGVIHFRQGSLLWQGGRADYPETSPERGRRKDATPAGHLAVRLDALDR